MDPPVPHSLLRFPQEWGSTADGGLLGVARALGGSFSHGLRMDVIFVWWQVGTEK